MLNPRGGWFMALVAGLVTAGLAGCEREEGERGGAGRDATRGARESARETGKEAQKAGREAGERIRGIGEAAGSIVTITPDRKFQPAEIRIQAGQTVTWTNTSSGSLTLTSDATRAPSPAAVGVPEGATPFHSGNISPSETFSHTFTTPGTYRYVSLNQPEMTGTVVVTQKE